LVIGIESPLLDLRPTKIETITWVIISVKDKIL